MGSRKDEMRSPAEDHQRCEMTENQVSPGSSDISPAPEGRQIDISQQSTSQEDYQSKLHVNAGNIKEGDEDPTPKYPTISKGLSGDTDLPDSIPAQDCIQTLDTVPQAQQTDAEPKSPVKPPPAMQGEEITSLQSTPDKFPAAQGTDGGSEERGKPYEEKEKDDDIEDKGEKEKVALHVSSAQDTPLPGTPARFGQQHMHTQVSLEVVQCHSVATSPMTPLAGDQAFFFQYSSGRSVETETKDAELQVGRQVEFRSVATAPMTPRTPTIPATFPEISGREAEHTNERTWERAEQDQADKVQQESCTVTKCPAEAESGPGIESIPALKCNTPKEETEGTGSNSFASPENSNNHPPTPLGGSLVTLEDSKQQREQHGPRMGSMDQDITILVTHHDSTEAEDEEGGVDTESSIHPTGQEVTMPDEIDELNINTSEGVQKAIMVDSVLGKVATIKQISTEHSNDGKNVGSGCVHDTPKISTNPLQNKGNIEGPSIWLSKHPQTEKGNLGLNKQISGIKESKEEDTCCVEEPRKVSQISEPECPPTNPATPSSPVPFGQHIRTQVSLEVVQCHSVATSPMTPPEGDQAFSFPYSSGRSMGTEMKDVELQVGQQVEFCSVATAPMTPKTPTAPIGFPEIRKDERIEKILEEEEDKEKKKPLTTEKVAEDKTNILTKGDIEEEVVEEKKDEPAVNEQEEKALKEKCEEKYEEPVQKVSWDEKGMTWEVYGAVVEVAVLGSAIQKHLEKQVKKHKKQPSLPPPPPLSPSAMPLTLTLTPTSPPTSGPAQGSSGKKKRGERDGKLSRRRRNPFRMMLQNMQQPHCCSRAHATE